MNTTNKIPTSCQEDEKEPELQKSLKNRTVKGPDGSIYEIKTDSTGNEWIDIGKVKKWVKRCPTCGRVEFCFLSTYKKLFGKNCRKCSISIRNQTEQMRLSVSISKRGNKNHFYGLVGDKNPARRPDVLKKLKEYQNRPDVKERHRRTYVDMMDKKRYHGGQFYNKHACEFMDSWGILNGYNFEHAMNGKELKVAAYWVDGYDKIKNVVFEYDEPHHYYRKGRIRLKKKDEDRMRKIQKELKCDFIRYNELTEMINHYKFEQNYDYTN